MIKAIGFDYGGVIWGEPGSKFVEELSKILGVNVEQFNKAYFSFNILLNTDKLTVEEFWKLVLTKLDRQGMLPELLEFTNKKTEVKINTDVLRLVDSLKEQGYKVGLLSNLSSKLAVGLRQAGVDKHFDVTLISAEIGFVKPEKAAFDLLAQKLGVTLKEMIFIDDTEKSLSSSKEIGFHPILFTNYDRLRSDLTDMLHLATL